ncbi:MAG: preprotein translocase subunit YajC [Bacteroidales bacterium]|jgi:preprotein translocase, YajC subunit|nr:preprotein translocase subunit YajC [Bacteroidales bacterium]MBR0499644.1 preprotein translocase subunit YajC [Bacteroidales bacterium]MBR6269732.1 preprotein translocase subunit YajC [Bacteroidales bacterium]
MNMLSISFLQQAAAGQGGGSGMTMLLMLALIFVVMWLFMIRPQQKRQKELNNFRDNLKKGDKVVTVGGIYGTIVEVNDNKVMLEIDKDVKIKVDKASLVKDFSDTQQA